MGANAVDVVAASGDWRGTDRADVLFSDEEIWALSQIDIADPRNLTNSISIRDHEMICQRDMKVRGRRLWAYHLRIGDLLDFLPLAAIA